MQPWSATLQHYSGYSVPELRACTELLARLHINLSSATTLPALREKYMSPDYGTVAAVPPLTSAQLAQLAPLRL